MGEIAAAAGMSRPALYLIFPDKEAVFEAVVRQMDDEMHAKIRAGLAKLGGLRDKLLHACQTWGSHGVDLAEAHPDAADLFDLRFPPVRRVYSRFEQFIVKLVKYPSARLGRRRFAPGARPCSRVRDARPARDRRERRGDAQAHSRPGQPPDAGSRR